MNAPEHAPSPAPQAAEPGSGEPMHQFAVVEEHDGDTIVHKWSRRRMPAGSAQGGAAPADAQRAADPSPGERELYRGPVRPNGSQATIIERSGVWFARVADTTGPLRPDPPWELSTILVQEILALAAERDAERAAADGLRAEVATLRAELATLRANAQDPNWLRHHLGLLNETPWAELTARAGEAEAIAGEPV